MKRKNLTLGIFGFGCVGQGLFDVLSRTNGIKATIKKICIKNPDKSRTLATHYFTTDKNEILNDPEIDVVVELINDEVAAFEIVKTAMQNGKAVVSASKKMIAENLLELYELQQQYKVPFLYEGACCASIPIIRNLEEYYDNDLLHSVEGIINGSTNYILTKIFDENISFAPALLEAQNLGFAETDPRLDIEGFDPKYKLCILLLHAFGLFVKPENIFNFGIQHINDFDISYARQKKAKIKLIAKCKKINNDVFAYVFPHLIYENSQLNNISNEYNGLLVESAFSDKQFFAGKGAGSTPTGSAVLSDISALSYNYRYEYRKIGQTNSLELNNNLPLKLYVRYSNSQKINLGDFTTIHEEFASEENKYFIGTIALEKVKQLRWLHEDGVNLLVV
ncbi:MAG: homoserine dehydrogenase [Bacteroidetes bacterium]|jgi:homoserine dehydrogenase|nr:homoserine dehydrogenase [Bacteroidota bacterium]